MSVLIKFNSLKNKSQSNGIMVTSIDEKKYSETRQEIERERECVWRVRKPHGDDEDFFLLI